MGLVKQAVTALTKRKIMQLTHTYITLRLSGKRGIGAPSIYLFSPFVALPSVCAGTAASLTPPLSCPRTDISEKVGLAHPDEAEAHILKMVEAGEICAQITSPAGTVHFREDAHVFSSAAMTSRLETDLQSTAELTERVRKLEARLMVNPAFIQKVCAAAACCCASSSRL